VQLGAVEAFKRAILVFEGWIYVLHCIVHCTLYRCFAELENLYLLSMHHCLFNCLRLFGLERADLPLRFVCVPSAMHRSLQPIGVVCIIAKKKNPI